MAGGKVKLSHVENALSTVGVIGHHPSEATRDGIHSESSIEVAVQRNEELIPSLDAHRRVIREARDGHADVDRIDFTDRNT